MCPLFFYYTSIICLSSPQWEDVAERIVFWVMRTIQWAVLVFKVQTDILLHSSSKKKKKVQMVGADSLISFR